MVGRDENSFPTQYRTWVVSDYPDFEGIFYTGLKSGPAPFIDTTAYEILDDTAIVDFNLPNPTNWSPVLGTMPSAVTNSQLAIIDGYAYLFGGEASDKIFKADINNPALWLDTTKTLPTVLSGSQLAIIDGYMYLFGGRTDETVDTIFTASVSDPLTWTNQGSKLVEKVHKSQLAIVDGYIYLFGGQGLNTAKSNIWRSTVADPLTWIDTGTNLPDKLYGSNVAIMNGKINLLGGLFAEDEPTKNVYSADLTNPLFFSISGQLPYECCYGQFLTIGAHGYLYTQAAVTIPQPYLTRIFRCNITSPSNWIMMPQVLPGDLTQSQFGIIYDRIFAFGGNGISALFTSDQITKYSPSDIRAINYGAITRTAFDSTSNPLDKTLLLGFPYWKTNYGS